MRDSGRGISSEQLAHIFDFFRHTDRSLVRSSGGLGVGLGLVKRLVELHGGRIVARSAGVGSGAQFEVTLPADVSSVPAAAEARRACRPRACRPRRGRRVLVVDDNVDSATSLMLLLQTMGHEVESAYDGVEALEAAQRFAPDTVVLDIGLPRMNGYEVARRLREQSDRHYQLIALTGWGQQEDRERAQEAGFDHHLVKPVDVDQLARLLETDAPAPLRRDELITQRGSLPGCDPASGSSARRYSAPPAWVAMRAYSGRLTPLGSLASHRWRWPPRRRGSAAPNPNAW